MASTLLCLHATSKTVIRRPGGTAGRTSSVQPTASSVVAFAPRLHTRCYASESAEYRHSFSGPPPPPPIPGRGLPSAASPSRVSSAVSSSSSSSSSGSATEQDPLTPKVDKSPSGPATARQTAYAPDFPASFGKNQHLDLKAAGAVDPSIAQELEAIVAHFRAPIRYAFAYGSAVFKQAGYTTKDKPMLDFVFAVSHPSHWHSININQNKDHYSLIARLFGSNVISILQTKVGAGVWFNVECMVKGRIIKYGVVSVDTLVHDLLDWETLYLAGRMHKPIHILRDEPRIRLANQVNLSSAIRASLLLLPETFSEEDLYRELAALSYRGDFRMQVGENPNKVKNIVTAQAEQFAQLYQPILRSFHKHVSFMGPEGSGSLRQDISPRAKADLARRLPLRVREMLRGHYERNDNILQALGKAVKGDEEGKKGNLSEETALWTGIAKKGDFKQNLDKSIQMIVGRPAFSQSAKGFFSVGPVRGVRYVWPKLKKKWSPSK